MRAPAKAIATALLLLTACRDSPSARATEPSKPDLFLLTALPLAWSEDFGIDQPGSPALQALEKTFQVTPIDLPSDLPGDALLFVAQPRALPAEELVALDEWVRDGGRMLLLADPMLEWPSRLPLGDPRRPPMAFADTGLLQHWGLRLDAPERRGPQPLGGGHSPLVFISPGTLESNAADCSLSRSAVTADCRIGKGRAIVIADADWLNQALVEQHGGRFPNHLAELEELLSALRSRR